MNKLKELIEKLCPNGVTFYMLGDLEDNNCIKLGRGNIISKDEIRNNPGDYPVYSSSSVGDGEIGRYGKYMFDDERITWSIDGGGKFFYRNSIKYSVTNVGGWIKVYDEKFINTKYLYYCLINSWATQKYDYTKKAHPSVIRNEYRIPVPPLEVQRKIVYILDTFVNHTSELISEYNARKKQYEYYKDRLLSFEKDVRYQPLGDACFIKARIGWQRLNKSEYLEKGDYYLVTGVDIKGSKVDFNSCYYVSKERYEMDENIQLKNEDIIITKDGTIGKVAFIENMDKPAVLNSHLFVIRDKSNTYIQKFLMYYFLSDSFSKFVEKNKTQGTIPGLNQATMVKFPLPIISIEEQQRIVAILDKFDKLCNDSSTGLPAEIEKRQKQYEYYRDKLLSFKEVEANE